MDWTEYLRFLAALLFVIGLIGLLAWVGRRSGVMPGVTRRVAGSARRLAVQEVAAIDPKRRLVLVRRDDIEHLILISATGELLIESGIPARPVAATTETPA